MTCRLTIKVTGTCRARRRTGDRNAFGRAQGQASRATPREDEAVDEHVDVTTMLECMLDQKAFALHPHFLHDPRRSAVVGRASSNNLRDAEFLLGVSNEPSGGLRAVSTVPILDARPVAELTTGVGLAKIEKRHGADEFVPLRQCDGKHDFATGGKRLGMGRNPSLGLAIGVRVRDCGSSAGDPFVTGQALDSARVGEFERAHAKAR